MAAVGVFERHTLSNGLRVLTAPMPQAQSVSCFVMLAAGSRYETADTNGIAHFAEHMFFKGTESRPTARDIAGEIDAIGGEFNAFTGKEYTGYYVKCAAEHRDTALDVLIDMIRNSKFDPEEIEREKGVIVEEMNMYYDTPRDYVDGVYDELLYGDQPLGWEQGAPRVKLHTKQSDQAHVRLGVHSYPLEHPDRYALVLLATALGGGMSSRLFTEVRERRGLAYYIYGYNQGYTDTGTLFAQGGVDINRIDDAVTTIVAEFARIAAEPLEPDELEKARNFAKGRLVLSLEDPKGMILFGLRDEVLEGRVREPEAVLAALDAVTLEDVQRVAQDVIRDERLNFALIGPFDEPDRFERLLSL